MTRSEGNVIWRTLSRGTPFHHVRGVKCIFRYLLSLPELHHVRYGVGLVEGVVQLDDPSSYYALPYPHPTHSGTWYPLSVSVIFRCTKPVPPGENEGQRRKRTLGVCVSARYLVMEDVSSSFVTRRARSSSMRRTGALEAVTSQEHLCAALSVGLSLGRPHQHSLEYPYSTDVFFRFWQNGVYKGAS